MRHPDRLSVSNLLDSSRRALRHAIVILVALLTYPSWGFAQSETIEYYGLDALGSVRVIFDQQGNVKDRMDYGPFGENLRAAITFPTEQFAQLARDAESGQDYAEARNYSVGTGRFNRVDPEYAGLFDPQGWNRYTYAANNPLRYVDATGLCIDPIATNTSSGVCADLDNLPLRGVGGAAGGDLILAVDDGDGQGGQLPGAPAPIPVPPIPVPPLPPGTPPDLQDAFDESFREGVRRVLYDQGCGASLGGESAALNAMYSSTWAFTNRGGPRRNPDGTWGLTGAFVSRSRFGVVVFLNSEGPFSNLRNPRLRAPGMSSSAVFDMGTGLRGSQLGAAMILHETGHVTGKFPPDAHDSRINQQNTEQVLRGCF